LLPCASFLSPSSNPENNSGRLGEQAAAAFLRKNGYKVLARKTLGAPVGHPVRKGHGGHR